MPSHFFNHPVRVGSLTPLNARDLISAFFILFPHLRVEACDSCRHYIKAVDLTLSGLAIPEVDELAAIPLDLWARENDYIKLQPNILGF